MLAFNIGVRHIASCPPVNERIHEQLWDSCPPSIHCSTYDRFLNRSREGAACHLGSTRLVGRMSSVDLVPRHLKHQIVVQEIYVDPPGCEFPVKRREHPRKARNL